MGLDSGMLEVEVEEENLWILVYWVFEIVCCDGGYFCLFGSGCNVVKLCVMCVIGFVSC